MTILLQASGATEFTSKNITSSVQLVQYTSEYEAVVGIRVDVGKDSELLDSAASNLTFVAKVTKSDDTVSEAYTNTVSKNALLTTLTHNFPRTIYLQAGEVLSIWLLSTNASDIAISGDVFVLGVRSSGGTLATSMERTEIIDWLETEFLPLELVTPAATQAQLVDNAIRYWNTHSGYKISKVYDYASDIRIQLDAKFKTVVQVYPTSTTTWIWNDHPLWTLLGITVLDNVTSDLIMMSETFRNYRQYVGTDFRWTFERSTNPAVGGYLYPINVPSAVTGLYVIGTRRIGSTESIDDDYILDWVLRYAKSLLKQVEGNTLRKADLINAKNDGQELVTEGKTEMLELQESLARNSRWVALAHRF